VGAYPVEYVAAGGTCGNHNSLYFGLCGGSLRRV